MSITHSGDIKRLYNNIIKKSSCYTKANLLVLYDLYLSQVFYYLFIWYKLIIFILKTEIIIFPQHNKIRIDVMGSLNAQNTPHRVGLGNTLRYIDYIVFCTIYYLNDSIILRIFSILIKYAPLKRLTMKYIFNHIRRSDKYRYIQCLIYVSNKLFFS